MADLLIEATIKSLMIFVLGMGGFAYTTWIERKFLARIQMRYGPNRAGKFGLLQPIADGLKLFFKEELTPAGADKVIFTLAPIVTLLPAMLVFAVIPVGEQDRRCSAESITWCSRPASTWASCTSWRSRPSPCTASRWRAGRRTTSTRCWAGCARRRK